MRIFGYSVVIGQTIKKFYWWPTRLTLDHNPPIYRWMWFNFKPVDHFSDYMDAVNLFATLLNAYAFNKERDEFRQDVFPQGLLKGQHRMYIAEKFDTLKESPLKLWSALDHLHQVIFLQAILKHGCELDEHWQDRINELNLTSRTS